MAQAGNGSEAAARITHRVKEHIGQEQYDKYLVGSACIQVDDVGVNVLTPTDFAAAWINRRFGPTILDAARHELGTSTCGVLYKTDPASFPGREVSPEPASAVAAQEPNAPSHRARNKFRTTINLRYSLDTFEVGTSNRLAFGAISSLLKDTPDPGISPLCIHGGCGIGKTHLLQGLASGYLKLKPHARVKYIEGEAFTNGFIKALRTNSVDSFRRQYRDLDLLCIDDVHFLANKTATQTEFLHTFNALGLRGSRIAMVSDEHPSTIRAFSKELSSRFLAGMVVQVEPPDEVLRESLVRRLAAQRGLMLDDGAVGVISWQCRESVRMIEGAVTRLGAVSSIDPPTGAMDAAYVRRAIGMEHKPSHRKPIRLDSIVKYVTAELQVDLSDVLGRSRHRRVVLARSLAGTLARRLTTCSFPEIARALGRPSHSTMVSAVKRLGKQLETGERFAGGGPQDGMLLEDVLIALERGVVAT